MKQIGQEKHRVLATDEWLRVKNCEGVYALGDCASVEQRKIVEDIAYIFKQADKDNNSLLSAAEFVETMEEVRLRYPQIDLYMDHKHMKGVIGLLDEALNSGDQDNAQLDLEHFSAAMSKVRFYFHEGLSWTQMIFSVFFDFASSSLDFCGLVHVWQYSRFSLAGIHFLCIYPYIVDSSS
jgi:NADH:ubiquinone reductase (non-electrogenic)